MILYHFTAGQCLRGIGQFGLTVGDVPTTNTATDEGAIGIWLTTADSADGHGLSGSILDKERFRLKVDAPDDNLHRWDDWSREHVAPQMRERLHRANGQAYRAWHVYFGQILPERIVEVIDLQIDRVVADWKTVWPESNSRPGVRYEGRFIWQKRMLRDVHRSMASSR